MKKTYTKILVFAVMLTYFLGFILGGILSVFYPEHLGEWLTFIGVPTSTAIGFYCWKAKAENSLKIQKGIAKEICTLPPEKRQKFDEVKLEVDNILQELEDNSVL